MNKLRVALFGGSFNPISIAHLKITKRLADWPFDKVLLIPCGFRQDKRGFASNEDRVAMIKIGVKDYLGTEPKVVNTHKHQRDLFLAHKIMVDLSELY